MSSNAGRRRSVNRKLFRGSGLDELKWFALTGTTSGAAYGMIHYLDGLLSRYPDFNKDAALGISHMWVRKLQGIEVAQSNTPPTKKVLGKTKKERSGTDFQTFYGLWRLLLLVIAPLAEARRQRSGSLLLELASLIEHSVPQSGPGYDQNSRQEPYDPALYAAVTGVEQAHREGLLPRLSDIVQAQEKAGLTIDDNSTAKRCAKLLREAGVEFDRSVGRRKRS